jgi:hypothetical protein
LNRFRRGIGNIRVDRWGTQETVSWLWYIPPEAVAYFYGFQSKKQFWSDQEIQLKRSEVIPKETTTFGHLVVFGIITLMPSFGGAYGTIDRHANPADLADVRIVLKVGERIIQPLEQPGNLLQSEGTELNTVAIPRYEYSTATASVYGSGGYANATVTSTRSYYTYYAEGYKWYQGFFVAIFPLFDANGLPHITPSDKEIQFIVIYGANQRKATYKLGDLVKIY